MSEHMEGRPVSTYTYRLGCRCDGCRREVADRMAHERSKRDGALLKVQSKVVAELVKWARANISPEERERITAKAYKDLGIERRKRGRPAA